MEITPQTLIDLTHNFYGLKADIAAALEFLSHNATATPGQFYDWIMRQH